MKTTDGIYPILFGRTVELGDYGYFEGDRWCKLGNIERITGKPIFLNKLKEKIGNTQNVSSGASLKVNAKTEIKALGEAVSSSLSFSSKDSFFIKAFLEDEIFYDSLDIEVKDFLEELRVAGKWKDNYRLIYSIIYSSSFITVISKSEGASVKLGVDLSDSVPLPDLKTNTDFSVEGNENTTEIIKSNKNTPLTPIGFKIISYEKKKFLRRKREIVFKAGKEECLWDATEDSSLIDD